MHPYSFIPNYLKVSGWELTRMIIPVLLVLLVPSSVYGQDLDSLLIAAAWNGQTEKVKTLLEAKADVEAKDENGDTALMAAAFNGPTEAVAALLEAGADVSVKNDKGVTALMLATFKETTPKSSSCSRRLGRRSKCQEVAT